MFEHEADKHDKHEHKTDKQNREFETFYMSTWAFLVIVLLHAKGKMKFINI